MAQVITLEGFRPSARYDSLPWTQAQIQEATSEEGPWTVIDTITLTPVDTDPERPQIRNFTTELASDTAELWYRVVFLDATADESQPTVPLQNIAGTDFTGSAPYATVEELAAILKVSAAVRFDALERVLVAAAGEIDAELDRTVQLSGWQLALAAEVNLERAVEHWQQVQSPFGLLGITDSIPAFVSRDTWERHALKLAPLKASWGIA